MPFGGFHPYPRRMGGGRSRVQTVLEGLNADRGTAYDATNRETTVYVHNMAIARAIAAAWSTNARLGNMWVPASMSSDVLARWEKILALNPAPTDTESARRTRIATIFSNVGQSTINGRIVQLLTDAIGDAFVAVENISYDNAVIWVPDGSYPWGSVGDVPWSSSVAHVLVRLQKPSGYTEADFYAAAAQVVTVLEPVLPAWTTVDWYRPGDVYAPIDGGPSASGFYLDDEHNLDNELLDDVVTVFDPATLALTGWWRASFAASPWVGTASAGTSGSHDLTEATNPPSVGSAVNGLDPADFDGTNDELVGATLGTLFDANQYSVWFLVYVDAIATNNANWYQNDTLQTDLGGGYWGVYLKSTGVVGIAQYDGSNNTAETSITTGAWQLVQVKYDGTDIKIRVNGGSWASTPSGNIQAGGLANQSVFGTNYNGALFFNGKALDIGASDQTLSDADFDDVLDYCRDRYALALT